MYESEDSTKDRPSFVVRIFVDCWRLLVDSRKANDCGRTAVATSLYIRRGAPCCESDSRISFFLSSFFCFSLFGCVVRLDGVIRRSINRNGHKREKKWPGKTIRCPPLSEIAKRVWGIRLHRLEEESVVSRPNSTMEPLKINTDATPESLLMTSSSNQSPVFYNEPPLSSISFFSFCYWLVVSCGFVWLVVTAKVASPLLALANNVL